MFARSSECSGERGHVARCSRHSAANATRVVVRDQNHDGAARGEDSVRQHAGRCEQNARAPRIRDIT
jgi:hypothetical protein